MVYIGTYAVQGLPRLVLLLATPRRRGRLLRGHHVRRPPHHLATVGHEIALVVRIAPRGAERAGHLVDREAALAASLDARRAAAADWELVRRGIPDEPSPRMVSQDIALGVAQPVGVGLAVATHAR